MTAIEERGAAAASLSHGRLKARREPSVAQGLLAAVFVEHYAGLVRLTVLLSRDAADAEDIAQDAFVRVYARADRLVDSQAAVGYLRTTVVNLCRMRARRRAMVLRRTPPAEPERYVADDPGIAAWRKSRVFEALRALPQRQREAVILRFYLDLTDAQIAESMTISKSAARAYLSRANDTLSKRLAGVNE
jgi:RNA polymerase sigma-70 factor (sigma-E family)